MYCPYALGYNVEITVKIKKKRKKKIKEETGMDQLSTKLLKLVAPLKTHAITVIFNKSIALGTIPCK